MQEKGGKNLCICIFFVILQPNKACSMHIEELAQLFALHPEIDVLAKELSRKREKHFLLSNLYRSEERR